MQTKQAIDRAPRFPIDRVLTTTDMQVIHAHFSTAERQTGNAAINNRVAA
jgi:hypothetical protein